MPSLPLHGGKPVKTSFTLMPRTRFSRFALPYEISRFSVANRRQTGKNRKNIVFFRFFPQVFVIGRKLGVSISDF